MMKLTINTLKLKEMLSKAVKGASNNKLIPITGLMAIERKDNILTLITTDATNYLYVREQLAGDDFYAVVQIDVFSKLVAKTTCDEITLELTNNYLVVTGNGTYRIEVPLDDDGGIVEYPNPIEMFSKINQIGTIEIATVKKILYSLKQSLMTTLEYPWYTCYYAGDKVIATDTYKISSLNTKLLDSEKLISAEQMNLLDVMTDEQIKVYAEGDKLLFDSDSVSVYGTETSGIEEFAVDVVGELVSQTFVNKCSVPKNTMLNMLDRISLFVGAYDNGEITLTFTKNYIEVTSKLATGVETIPYISEAVVSDSFVCSVNIDMLIAQIKAQSGDSIQIQYGEDNAIKLVDNDVTSIIALLTD